VLPIEEHGFALHKGAFRDALCLHYGWLPSGLPARCVCGQGFTVNHAMNYAIGGFPTLRHRDFTAAAMSEVCHNVAIEPVLQPLSGEAFHVSVQGFLGDHHQRAFLMEGSSIPTLLVIGRQQFPHYIESLNVTSSICMSSAYEMFRWAPSPFGFFYFWVATTAYKWLASLLAAQRNQDYGSVPVVSWIRCFTSFSLLRLAVTCLRRARSHRVSPMTIGALDLVIAEGQVVPSY